MNAFSNGYSVVASKPVNVIRLIAAVAFALLGIATLSGLRL